MKNLNKHKRFIEAVIVIAVALAFTLPTSAVVTNSAEPKICNSNVYTTTVSAVHKVLPSTPASLGTDVLISSDNPSAPDETPKVTMNSQGVIVVAYEKEIEALNRIIPVAYSDDKGASWTTQFEFDSTDFQEGSGFLQSVDIKYSPAAQQFFWQAIDPLATSYNEELAWIPGDIAGATEATWYGISGQSATGYTEGGLTVVGKWVVGLTISDDFGFIRTPGLGYMWYDEATTTVKFPVDVDPAWAAGYYYDGQSVLHTASASQPELATGNRLYMVMQSDNGVYSNISFKTTVTDLTPSSPTFLFTSGGGPSGMDKYADIEVWPLKQEYVADHATDPDVSAKADKVAVVYVQGGDVKCSYSTNGGDAWSVGTVATGAGYPCVYVTSEKIHCAYVKEGNLFLTNSTDGTTWTTPVQMNDQAGTVAAQEGTVDLGAAGLVWTDSRNGENDIYFEYVNIEPPQQYPKLIITAVNSGIHVSATIKNEGDIDAANVAWEIKVVGGIFGRINEVANGTIDSLAVGAEETVATDDIIIGWGAVAISVTASCEGSSVIENRDGKHYIIYTKVTA
jgi:hypothetical protein